MELVHYHFENLTSTNDWAKGYLKSADQNLITLVTADHQTQGRGQFGRKWISPAKKNLYGSFIFFIKEDQQEPLSLTHVLALSIARTLETYQVTCRIKWPNDIHVNQKKIAGILCETEHFSQIFGVVIGFGININMTKEELQQIGQPATSLFAELGFFVEKEEVMEKLKDNFQNDLALFLKSGFAPFSLSFQNHLIQSSKPTSKKLESL